MVPQAAAQAAGGAAAQIALGLPAGGDAVDGRRLRPGEAVEGGRCPEGGFETQAAAVPRGHHAAPGASSVRAEVSQLHFLSGFFFFLNIYLFGCVGSLVVAHRLQSAWAL